MNDTASETLPDILAALRALHWVHWTAHWQASGASAYGDHLLFARLYEGIVPEIDGLAEKIVAQYGPEGVGVRDSITRTFGQLQGWSGESGLVESAIQAERAFQKRLAVVYAMLEDAGELTLGLDNFLQGIADTHETHIFLLQQRLAAG